MKEKFQMKVKTRMCIIVTYTCTWVPYGHASICQGRRRFLKSGSTIERHRRSTRAEGPSRARAREGELPPSRKGGSGDLPRENFKI